MPSITTIIKTILGIAGIVLAAMIPTLRAKVKDLSKTVEEQDKTIENLHENTKINKTVAASSYDELSSGLLARQKNRSN